MSEKERNLRVADSICTEFAWNGQTFREGDCVAVLDGQVVAVADNPGKAISALRALDPDRHHGMVVEVGRSIVGVIRMGRQNETGTIGPRVESSGFLLEAQI